MDNHHSCQFCQKNFSTDIDVMDHMRSHVEGTSFTCIFCPETFSSKSETDDHHKRNHSKEMSFCDITKDKVTQEQDSIKRSKGHEKDFPIHIQKKIQRSIHAGVKHFECDICKKRFITKHHLNLHNLTHKGEKPFGCDICKKRFTRRSNLETHIRTHTGEKPFECNICKKRFTTRQVKEKHIRSHTGEKPFECDICDKRFTQRPNLETHIRSHTREKPFQCDICKNRFTLKHHLKQHTLTHKGGKPFECDICKKRFTMRQTLETHICTHARNNPFGCDICKKRFTKIKSLRYCIQTHTCKVKLTRIENVQGHVRNSVPFCGNDIYKSFERKCDLNMHLKTSKRRNSPSPNLQQSFANLSTRFVASNSEDLLNGKDARENVADIPVLENIKKEYEDTDLRFHSEIDSSDVKQSFERSLEELAMDVKIENMEFKEELV